MKNLGILGGGLAGLSFANFFDGESVILEKNNIIGGLCRSFNFNDVIYDIGPHIIFSKNKEVLDFHTGLIDTNTIKRSNSIYYKGRFVKYPFENDLFSLPSRDKDYCLNEFLNNPYENYDANNMLQFFLKTFGEGITRLYLQPYNEKIWKFDSSCMDLQMVSRIPKPPKEDVINSSKGISTEGYKHQLFFHYPKSGGIQSLINAYGELIKNKTEIVNSVEILSISKINSNWNIETKNKGEFLFDSLINCMPIHELFKYLKAPKEIVNTLNCLKYNSIYIVMINIKKDYLGDQFAIYVPDKDIIFHRITKLQFLGSNYKNKDGSTTLLAEITFRPGSDLSKKPVSFIKQEVINGLVECSFINEKDIYDITVEKHEYAYPIYDLDHRKNTDIIQSYLNEIGIRSVGRFAEFEYMNTDKVAENSMKLASELNEELKNE